MVHDVSWGCQRTETTLKRCRQFSTILLDLWASNLGRILLHSCNLPVRTPAASPAPRSSVISNLPVLPRFTITVRNQKMAVEHGLIRSWHLPFFQLKVPWDHLSSSLWTSPSSRLLCRVLFPWLSDLGFPAGMQLELNNRPARLC